jgi:hypothetical protein
MDEPLDAVAQVANIEGDQQADTLLAQSKIRQDLGAVNRADGAGEASHRGTGCFAANNGLSA